MKYKLIFYTTCWPFHTNIFHKLYLGGRRHCGSQHRKINWWQWGNCGLRLYTSEQCLAWFRGPFLQHQPAYKLPCKLLTISWLESINSTKLLQMILNLTAGEEILLTLPANIGTKSRLRLILLELPEDKLSASCTLSVPVQTTLVKLSDCSVDTNNSVSLGSGSGGTFMAPEDGVYKAVYNGK